MVMATQQWRSKMWAHQEAQSKNLDCVWRGLSNIVDALRMQRELQERRHKEIIRMMKWLGLGLLASAFLLGGLVYSAVAGETSFNGGLGGLFVFEDGGVFDVSSYSVGVTYRPDRVEDVSTLVKGKVVTTALVAPSPFMFWTNRVIRDNAGDIDFVGLGYSIWSPTFAMLEIIPEVAGTIKYLDNDKARLGAYGGVRIPFSAGGNAYRLVFGGGWEGDHALVAVSLNFATE